MKINADNVTFILVEPQFAGNIGSAARALKTMGFSDLRLVNPCNFDVPEGRAMAHGSQEILANARVFVSLPEALADVEFVVATSNRLRIYHFPTYTHRELAEKAVPLSRDNRIAIVFGREQTGLTNEEMRCCQALSSIPAAIQHPSLNLAQSVMVYACELFQATVDEDQTYRWRMASYGETESVYRHLEESLRAVDFEPNDNWEKFVMRFRRMFGRAHPEVRDVQLMHKILSAFDEKLEALEKDHK